MFQQVAENAFYYHIPGVRSATIAFIVGSGPVYEPDHLLGISHFIEHVSFRKTKRRTMRKIKLPIEEVGGVLNAWTDKETTVFYAKVPASFFKTAFNILREIVFEPDFTERNVELERKIILEEYYSEREVPEQRLFNTFFDKLVEGPHSKPIIGREDTIRRITVDDIRSFHAEMYTPYNVKVFVAGNVTRSDLSLLEKLNLGAGLKTAKHVSKLRKDVVFDRFEESQQFHVLLAHEGVGLSNEEKLYATTVLNTVLGSGMSSVLFEQIRERKGLVYDVATWNIQSREWGLFAIYAATSEKNVHKLLRELFALLRNFKLTEKLFSYGKRRLLGMLELATESTSALTNLYIQYVANEVPVRTIDELIERVKAVTQGEVMDAYNDLTSGTWSLAYVTPGQEISVGDEDLTV